MNIILRFVAVASAAVLLLGCASVRAAREAQDPAFIPPGERTVTSAEAGLSKDSVLTLPRAVEIALAYHSSIIQSRQGLLSADKQFADARSSYMPNSDAGVSYRKSDSESGGNGNSYSASLSLSQWIYDFGKTPAAVRQSYENKLAAEANLQSVSNNICYNVRQAYYNLIKQQSLVKVAEETVNQFVIHLEQTKGLAEVGKRIKYDITKSEVDLGNARISLINAVNDLRIARAVLDNAMGLADAPEYKVEEPAGETMEYKFEELYQTALRNQPELAALSARERAASAAVDQAVADLFPSLSMSGSYGLSGSAFPLSWSWSLGAALSQTIFDGFRNSNQIDKAVASLRSSRAARAGLEQQLYLDLSRAVTQLENASQKLDIAALVVQKGRENSVLIQEQYKIGKASSVELADAMVSLTNAQVQELQARFDYQTAIALIKKTIGRDAVK
ncbi:MAG: TolC family protein [Planctomycetes bacterium]|nr:TolC family protein [Planctomycetota bacterium]